MGMINRILNSFAFWGGWIIIPLLMEIIPSFGNIILLIKRRLRKDVVYDNPAIYPEITLIIPVYNSEDTLYACIESIHKSSYPNESIHIYLVNNKGQDDSFSVYAECQKQFTDLRMQWLNAEQGKSRALNLALYNSQGKYIINLDSDGVLEPSALRNMVVKFEANPDLNCMTGTILTMPDKIREYKGFFPRLLRNLEFMEYAQAFLAGRSYASENNTVYTLAGAFSAFRKSAVLSSWMYNTDTICEDTHITFQMRYRQNERIEICENAIYFVDPIEDFNKLYTQRQRWQRGSLEVAQMFSGKKLRMSKMFSDVTVKTLLFDHTFAFPRMIWYIGLLCLMVKNYSGTAIIYSTALIFGMYIIVGLFYYVTVIYFLRNKKDLKRYYAGHWWCVFLLPFFNFLVFFIRFGGIINSINTRSSWRTKNLTEEWQDFRSVVKKDSAKQSKVMEKIRSVMNVKPVDPIGSTDPIVNAESIESVEPIKSSGPIKSAEIIKSVEPIEIIELIDIMDEVAATQEEPLSSNGENDNKALNDQSKESLPGYKKTAGWYICINLVYLISLVLIYATYSFEHRYSFGITQIMEIFTDPSAWMQQLGMYGFCKDWILPLVILILILVLVGVVDHLICSKVKLRGMTAIHTAVEFGSAIILVGSVLYMNYQFGILAFIM